jgi:hypothetical protein
MLQEVWVGYRGVEDNGPSLVYELCDIYGTPEYRALSQRNQANRCASGLTTSHYSGSISAYQHARNLVNTLVY